jgi:hypothetical protein
VKRLRNITITLQEHVARWARIEAARRDISVSRLLADILEERMAGEKSYRAAMQRALQRAPIMKSDGKYPSREEIHGRTRLC